MDWPTSEVVTVLAYLLPGFVAAAIFYSVTSYPKPNEFSRVIQALVYTVVAQAITWASLRVLDVAWTVDSWPEGAGTVVSLVSAVALGLIAACFSNHDMPHRFLRHVGFTNETSYPSEWYSAFSENPYRYVVLQLKDGRRLYGWPEEWPGRPDEGHFRIAECEWLVENRRIRTPQVSAMLVPGNEVGMVEFLEPEPQEGPTE